MSAQDFADGGAGDVARGLADREEAPVERNAPRERGLTVVTGNLGFVDIVEKVQLGFLVVDDEMPARSR